MGMKGRRFKKDARGFKEFGQVTCSYGSTIRVKESSAAMSPRVWLFVDEDPSIMTKPELGKVAAHLTFQQVRKLIRALEDSLEHHYHLGK
jgi:hypothetical protein